MRIRMLTLSAGPEGTMLPGQVYDVTRAVARELIAGAYAEEAPAAPVTTNDVGEQLADMQRQMDALRARLPGQAGEEEGEAEPESADALGTQPEAATADGPPTELSPDDEPEEGAPAEELVTSGEDLPADENADASDHISLPDEDESEPAGDPTPSEPPSPEGPLPAAASRRRR